VASGRPTLSLLVGVALAALSGGPSRAASLLDESTFAAAIRIDAAAMRAQPPPTGGTAAAPWSGMFGAGARGFAGPTVGWIAGLDAHLGASWPAGALVDFNLRPLGLGLCSHGILLGVVAGVGAGGVPRRIPFGLQIPVEALLEADLGSAAHIGAWTSVSWVKGAGSRRDGSMHAPFGDELSAGAALRMGRGARGRRHRWGNGLLVGVTYAEQLGGRVFGALLGYGITMSQESR